MPDIFYIKHLDWEIHEGKLYHALGVHSKYHITVNSEGKYQWRYGVLSNPGDDGWEVTLKDAKEACQKHFEKRVMRYLITYQREDK